MFLRATIRKKDGKSHRYWIVVENARTKAGRVVQRHVLYLGEINDAQRAAWCKTIEVIEDGRRRPVQVAIFPEDRQAPALDCAVVQVHMDRLRLERPRQWGACWLALGLWGWLALDEFWTPRLPVSREGTRVAERAQDAGGVSTARVPAVSGGCIGSGLRAVRWAICSARIWRWRNPTRCTAAWESAASRTSRRCLVSSRHAGRVCSGHASRCCSMT